MGGVDGEVDLSAVELRKLKESDFLSLQKVKAVIY